MNRLKRWSTSIVAHIDRMVAQVENHQGLADSVIREVQRAAARAKVQLARVRQDGGTLRRRLAEDRDAEIRWKERARGESDEDRALECLRRSHRAARQVKELERRLGEHERAEQRLARDVRAVEERLSDLKQRRNLMRTRQSRAEALSAASGAGTTCNEELHDIFDRWETRITELEFSGEIAAEDDPLEADYVGSEELEDLRAELEELRAGTA